MSSPFANAVDPAWKGLYKAGGASFLLAGVLLVIEFLGFFLLTGPIPTSGVTALNWASQRPAFDVVVIVGVLLRNFFLIPAGFALYFALKGVRKTQMFVATGLLEAGIILNFVQGIVFYSLAGLSDAYLAATTEVQRAAYVAAADLAVNIALVVATPVVDALVAISVLIISYAMLKEIFGKATAYLGIATGILGLAGVVPTLSVAALISDVLLTIWVFPVGYKLYRLG